MKNIQCCFEWFYKNFYVAGSVENFLHVAAATGRLVTLHPGDDPEQHDPHSRSCIVSLLWYVPPPQVAPSLRSAFRLCEAGEGD